MINDSLLNLIALGWFLFLWVGYAYFAKYKAKRGCNLSSMLNRQRLSWMQLMLERDNRVADAILIANLERNCSFLASTSILVLAGLLTSLSLVGDIEIMLETLPFYKVTEERYSWIYLKILTLIFIYVYAFFTLTWSSRQYGFASMMIGSAPHVASADEDPLLKQRFAYASSKIIDMAGHTCNFGLRAYLLSLAILPWFFSPWYFIASSTFVVLVLYSREFHSRPYRVLREYLDACDKSEKPQHET